MACQACIPRINTVKTCWSLSSLCFCKALLETLLDTHTHTWFKLHTHLVKVMYAGGSACILSMQRARHSRGQRVLSPT
eukprot:scaffold199749_cov17-Tisochrysis_lutea.AAC.1